MWRSLLFVPVLNHRLVKSAARCYADAIVLDLEASVPEHRKEEARKVLLKAFSKTFLASSFRCSGTEASKSRTIASA